MRHIRVRSYFFVILSILLALSGPISSITFFSQNSAAKTTLDDATLDIFAENNIIFYDPSEKLSDCTPTYGAKPSGNQVTWIGDSYSVGSKTIIEEKLPGVDLYIQDSKTVSGNNDSNPSGLSILSSIKDSALRPYLVFALGTNSGWKEADIDELSKVIDEKGTKVVLVTSRTENGDDYTTSNNLIKAAAEDNKNIYLADWASDSVYKKEYFSDKNTQTKTHPEQPGGYEAWVNVIYNALPGGTAKSISGGNSVEVMWSYLANTGLFTSEQIAGIIGNAAAEVGGVTPDYPDVTEKTLDLNPLLLGTGWAKNQAYLFQWTKTANGNKAKLDALMSPQYGQYLNDKYYYEATPSSIPIEDRKGIIEIQLKYAIEVGGGASVPSTWIKEVQAQTTVAAAAEAFLVSFEGAIGSEGDGYSQAIQEYQPISSTYKKFIKQSPYQRRDARVGAAQQIYEMYKGYSGSSMNCNPVNADASDALAFLQQYVRDINYFYDLNAPMPQTSAHYVSGDPSTYTAPMPDTSPTLNKSKVESSSLPQATKDKMLNLAGCFGGANCAECTALSGWFVTMFSSYTYGGGSGYAVANNLAAKNSELEVIPFSESSSADLSWSIFSLNSGDNGHTGIIMESSDGNAVALENNLGWHGGVNPERILAIKDNTLNSSWSFVSLKNGLDFSHLGTSYGE